ncbi:MAG: TRAP transporter large permease subunit [Alphaproteobacteria bacterium]|nr:TRAP transporter large permease subunit [Alphaproteobacteria bacterium]
MDSSVFTSVAAFGLVLLFLGTGTWIFAGLLLVSVTGLHFILDFPLDRIGAIAKGVMWRSASTWELSAIPIFIMAGEIIYRTDISERLFRGLAPNVDWLPGRLLHTNILGCTLFAAVSGSSTATTATVGKITINELLKRKYNENLAIGSLAGAGSLGLMIPPSIVMIVYGVLAEVSIAKLFAAGVIPGLMLSGMYTIFIAVRCVMRPDFTPESERLRKFTWGDRARGFVDLSPVLILILLVLGSIYTGLATPSEAAAIGLAASMIIAFLLRQMNWKVFVDSLIGAVRLSCMVCSILVAAAFLSSAMGYLHVPQDTARFIGYLELSPYMLIVVLSILYLILGCFLDGISMTVMTLPIALPLIMDAGFDPLWFGIYLVVMVELAAITPPIGFNLFVLQGLTGYPIGRVAYAAFPFFIIMLIATAIITAYPEIATWLPNVLMGKPQ